MRRFLAAASVLAATASVLLPTVPAGAEEIPNPATMPVPKGVAPQPPPPVLPQGENVRTLLKYKGEPMSGAEISKPVKPAPMVAPSKL